MFVKNSNIDSSANTISEEGDKIIETVNLDEDIKEKIDIIKMDIEGEEYNALIGCKNHIINDKPILLISVYHNNTDLFRIPKLIYEYNNNYKFYLRNYGNNIFPTEIVLYAILKKWEKVLTNSTVFIIMLITNKKVCFKIFVVINKMIIRNKCEKYKNIWRYKILWTIH